jgi:uncharacterized FAD-dependent dehydrogenase
MILADTVVLGVGHVGGSDWLNKTLSPSMAFKFFINNRVDNGVRV